MAQMTLFRDDIHIGRPPKRTGRYRYYTEPSLEVCHREKYHAQVYVVRDKLDPEHRSFISPSRSQLKKAVMLMNKINKQPGELR